MSQNLTAGCCILASILFLSASKPSSAEATVSPALSKARAEAFQRFVEKKYPAAIEAYEAARRIALAERNTYLAVQFMSNIASAYFYQAKYSSALASYRIAGEEARRYRLPEMESLVASNQASLFLALGQPEQAVELLSHYPADGSSLAPNARMDYFLIQSLAHIRLHHDGEAFGFFRRALAEAERPLPSARNSVAADARTANWPEQPNELRRSRAMNLMGESLLYLNRYAEAEPLLLESFRIRSTFHDSSRYFDVLQLARIARAGSDLDTAARLLSIAGRMDREGAVHPHRFVYYRELALLQVERGNIADAPAALRQAQQAVQQWRAGLMAQNSVYLSFESFLNTELQQKFANLLARPDVHPDGKFLIEESFWLAEEARFAAMRGALFPALQLRERMPESYWATLARYQQLATEQIAGNVTQAAQLRSLELELDRQELDSGLAIPRSTENTSLAFEHWQRRIPADEAVFSFYLAEPYSLAWMVTNHSIELRRIPGKAEIGRLVRCFRDALLRNSQNEPQCSSLEIYIKLFGEFSSSRRTIPYWTLVLDGDLFDLPFAALQSKEGRYVVQDHTVRILPSALYLKSIATEEGNQMAIGFADPIYNAADPRLETLSSSTSFLRSATLTLNRLPASAQELRLGFDRLARRHWKTQTSESMAASPANLRKALEASPDVIHVASHVVSSPNDPAHLSLALSLNSESRQPSLFSPLDFNTLRSATRLLVLSGCHSASGQAVSGLGINGLSRAALIAGVRSVIATLWPVEDSTGPLFDSLYRELPNRSWTSRSAADSLRRAQLSMLDRRDWFSHPAYWASYIAIARG